MIWPPQETELFEFKKPCCSCGSPCPGGLLIPFPEFPEESFADLAAAEAALADPNVVLGCSIFNVGFLEAALAVFETWGAGAFGVHAATVDGDLFNQGISLKVSLNLVEGATLTIGVEARRITPAGTDRVAMLIAIYDCFDIENEDPITSFNVSSPADVSQIIDAGFAEWVVPETSEYVVFMRAIKLSASATPLNDHLDLKIVGTSDGAISVNPVKALYFDGADLKRLTCV